MKNKLVEIFKRVQKIPYKVCKFEKDKINENLKFGDCRHKSELLFQLLTKEGYEIKRLKVMFDWKDLPLPESIISVLAKSSTIWAHDSLEVKVGSKWLKVDCTWSPDLADKGFPVQLNWDGETDTLQVTKGNLQFIDKDKFDKTVLNIDPQEAMKFADLLNDFVSPVTPDRWFLTLSRIMNPIFSKEQFDKYTLRHKQKLEFYNKYILGNRRVLDLGCGFGYSSIPLSNLGFKMVSIDNDSEVISVIKENASNFGGNIKIMEADIFDLPNLLEKDSFDASISGGLLEHFNKEEIRKIINIQLEFAPIVILDVPIHSDSSTIKEKYADFENKICLDGVFRNLWDKDKWNNEILEGFNIIFSEVSTSSEDTGQFEKLTVVIKR